ncbi:MAG: FAD:protein FMN transferase, partial [Pseudomonadota bacterium]
GFGAPGVRAQPTDAAVGAALARAGHDRVLSVAPGALRKRHADAQVYLAGIGKGYGADHIGRALKSLGVRDFMVEIGGDIYAAGRNPDGQPWRIGIETPRALGSGVFETVGVTDLGLASSGDYRNFIDHDGERFTHVIDPATGQPITHATASATVLAENAMLADAWSTAMLTLGSERGLEIADAQGVAVLFIDRDGDGFTAQRSARFDALAS